MKVLLVKTSSLGDVAHTLAVIREAKLQRPDVVIDWLVEKNFTDVAELVKQQGFVNQIIPIEFRKWRKKKPLGIINNSKIKALKQQLKSNHYDLVIDAQGLLKSAYLARLADAPISGFNKLSAREGWASYAYANRYQVNRDQHAIHRLRQLFSQALGYELPRSENPVTPPRPIRALKSEPENMNSTMPNILLVHATTWDNKHYPIGRWRELVQQLTEQGMRVFLPQNSDEEYANAAAIIDGFQHAEILPKQSIRSLIDIMKTMSAVVSVDTGLAHLSSYLNIPTVALFGPTNPKLTGVLGANSKNLTGQEGCAPCMKRQCFRQEKNKTMQQQSPCMNDIDTVRIDSLLEKLIKQK